MVMFRTLSTGILDLDMLMEGGLALDSLSLILGPSGSGKTILAQQILCHHARLHPLGKSLYLTTTPQQHARTMATLRDYELFDASLLRSRIIVEDISDSMYNCSADALVNYIVSLTKKHQADLVMLDSYAPLHDAFMNSDAARRLFYEMTLELASAGKTTLLFSEWGYSEMLDAVKTGIIDSVLLVEEAKQSSPSQGFLRMLRLHGRPTAFMRIPFVTSTFGIQTVQAAGSTRREANSVQAAADHSDRASSVTSIIPTDGSRIDFFRPTFRSPGGIEGQIAALFGKSTVDLDSANGTTG